jgi:hypothetical protein
MQFMHFLKQLKLIETFLYLNLIQNKSYSITFDWITKTFHFDKFHEENSN